MLYGKSDQGSKKVNYQGKKLFKSTELTSFYVSYRTNVGASTLQIAPFLFFSLIRRNPDLILTEGASNIVNASIAFLYAKIFRKKIIWWSLGEIKNRTHLGIRKYLQNWIDFLAKHSDAIFTYSTQGENFFLSKGIPSHKIFKGINVNDTEQKLQKLQEIGDIPKKIGFNIVFVGAITKGKNLEKLFDSYKQLKNKHSDIYLHVIGDGTYLETIKQYAHQLALYDVKFYGKVVGDNLSTLLLQFHVLVLPGMGGLAIVDGMLHSLPIICGKADGTEIDLVNDSCGFLKEDLDVNFLSEKLEYLYLHPQETKIMGMRGFERITQQFSINHYMQSLYQAINYTQTKIKI